MQHKFVENIPDQLEEGVLYISLAYCTAIHKCVCGCGNEVVTPLSPTDWELTFNGETISLHPSIGNWSFECRSHYFIIKNEIRHALKWSSRQIETGRKVEHQEKKKHFKKRKRKKNK